jgi:hypothetical protein
LSEERLNTQHRCPPVPSYSFIEFKTIFFHNYSVIEEIF